MHTLVEQAGRRFEQALEHLRRELSSLRSSRATPALIEHVRVEAYGTATPLIELASITAPEPRLLVVSPWDRAIIKDIERALQAANVGASPVVDGALIRLNLPALTEERRRELVKVVRGKLEEGRVALRSVREDVLKELRELKASGQVGEDEFFVAQKDLQKQVDAHQEQAAALGAEKEREVMTI